MGDRGEMAGKLIAGVRDVLGVRWDEFDQDLRDDFELVSRLAAKVSAKEAAGEVEWARRQIPHIESMLADMDVIASGMATRAFWDSVNRAGEVLGSVLVGAAKAAL